MRNFLAIARKELYTLFTSPIAYVVLTAFYFITGFFFYSIVTWTLRSAEMASFRSQQFGGPPPPIDMFGIISASYFGNLSVMLLFVVPMITMGIFADERKRGTIELLFTSPVRGVELILGKYAAVLAMLAVMLAPTVVNLLLLYTYSEPSPPLAPVAVGYLGALLLGATMMAIGIFISSMTENQIIAAIVTFVVSLVFWLVDGFAGTTSTFANEAIRYLSVLDHYEAFTRGIIDSQNLVFYVSFIILGLYLTSVSLDSVKWRQ